MKAPSSSVPSQASATASQEQPQTVMPQPRIDWNGLLKTVQELPLAAPDWEAIPQFLETLQQLYEKNQQERRDQRGRLQKALGDLTTPQAREMLGFFDMRDVSQWAAERCPTTHITTAVQSTEQFRSLLLEYYKYDRQPRPATLAKKHLRGQKAGELEGEIAKIHERLTELFISLAQLRLLRSICVAKRPGNWRGRLRKSMNASPSCSSPPPNSLPQPHNGQEHQAEAEPPALPRNLAQKRPTSPFRYHSLSKFCPKKPLPLHLEQREPPQFCKRISSSLPLLPNPLLLSRRQRERKGQNPVKRRGAKKKEKTGQLRLRWTRTG